ncbi:hypothetical protein BCR41DRAFT_356180 [Lobosporangium transversale]|uniref:Ras guanine nucleotide exchange factor domain-containing protein n=1 Tax=Lobosporangium transversale TaxID=64571 RepID=A0A1Y2GJA3_9FUNG|nr:hypothetical protein BCR41DRAFT_356180 [Lobosporangium transversale]ORZ12497.1 hypothetical protein BCR41DRAFT_356180 [Lobosporangium transversale]|eukprot:XP_021880116.1 hypothetical protein BCR41DRAFT_356180 [Lobosporangium transversale]
MTFPAHSLHSSHSYIAHPLSPPQSTVGSTPAAQTVATPTLTNLPPCSHESPQQNSLKGRNLFSNDRCSCQPPPLSYSSIIVASNEVDQNKNLSIHQHCSRKDFSSLEDTDRMQQIDYMPEPQQGFSLPLHKGPAALSARPGSLHKPTLSSKRMRPPLAEISTSVIPSLSTTQITSSPLSSEQNYQTGPCADIIEHSKSTNHTHRSNKVTNNVNQTAHGENMLMHDQLSRPLPLSLAAVRPLGVSQQLYHYPEHLPEHANINSTSLNPVTDTETSKPLAKKNTLRCRLSRDARALRTRIRKLWMDPRESEQQRTRRNPKNQYIILEESLLGILQMVPPIVQNAKAPKLNLSMIRPIGHLEPGGTNASSISEATPVAASIHTTESSIRPKAALPLSSAPWTDPSTLAFASSSSSHSKSSGSTPTTPVHTRTRTTSTNSASTVSATRYQIATSILQPIEPPLTDVAQPTALSPTSTALLGEPALSTIMASVVSPSSPATSTTLDASVSEPCIEESSGILINKLLMLSSTFTGAIRTLCEQQNEKVLRFDDDMILDLLTRWEQEAGKTDGDEEPDNSSSTSLVTLGATNALERYQLMVSRVWEETEVILLGIRKVRDLVEFGRVQHFPDFDDDDSEEDSMERNEEVKQSLYSTLLLHSHGLVTVLGEFLECVSGIQRLVGTLKSQRKDSQENQGGLSITGVLERSEPASEVNLMFEEPRPVKHLDPALMRKLKPKAPFKSIADKVRRSFSDFAQKSTNSLLKIFPPLGDGTNEGFDWDSYSDGEYDSEELVPSEVGSSLCRDGDAHVRTLSPLGSPGLTPNKQKQRQHRPRSKDSSDFSGQYWPGSTRLGLSDDSMSPTNVVSPSTVLVMPGPTFDAQSMATPPSINSERTIDSISVRLRMSRPGTPKSLESFHEETEPTCYFTYKPEPQVPLPPLQTSKSESKEMRHSILSPRRNPQKEAFTGLSISTPIPSSTRPFSVYSSESEAQTASPSRNNYKARPPKPPVLSQAMVKEDELNRDAQEANQERTPNNRTSSCPAIRTISALHTDPVTLDSPFTRQTSIRMVNDRDRYSVKMPSDDILEPRPARASSRNSSPTFWRRRSYNDALGKSRYAVQLESDVSALSTPLTSEFSSNCRSSVRLSSYEFLVPFFSKEDSSSPASTATTVSTDGSRMSSGSYSKYSSTIGRYNNHRRHSSPLIPGVERALADTLGRRTSVSLNQNCQLVTKTSIASVMNRNSVHMLPTLTEDSNQQQQQQQYSSTSLKSPDQLALFTEVECLGVRSRPWAPQKDSNAYDIAARNHGTVADYHSRSRDYKEQQMQVQNQYQRQYLQESQGQCPENNEDRKGDEMPRRPITEPRLGDMRKAWEIMNLDAKRVNPYSHLRAYARSQPGQNNLWALNHPNALQSSTSPRVLHICENNVDVLVLQMSGGYLQVVAGLLEKLIERLADQNEQDSEYISCFLLSHSFFIDSEDLLKRLIARFHIQPRQGEMLYFEKWQVVIQIKVLCVLYRWIQLQYEDFERNPNLLKTLKKFLEVDVRMGGFVKEAGYIEERINIRSLSPKKNCSVIMEQGRFCLQRSRTRKISLSKSQSRSPHPLASPGGVLSNSVPHSPGTHVIEQGPAPELSLVSPILQVGTLELARYLTLADMKAFRSITVYELMSSQWQRRQAAENTKRVNSEEDEKTVSGLNIDDSGMVDGGAIEAFTRRANMLSYWVAHEILSIGSPKTRKQLIKKFIEVAKICRSLNNLHTCMFIVSALISTPVRRLAATWKLIKKREMKSLQQLEQLLDPSGNMRCYRQALGEIEAPAIPFLPILLKDITFILDGNPTMIPSRFNGQPPPVSAKDGINTNKISRTSGTAATLVEKSNPLVACTSGLGSGMSCGFEAESDQGQLVNFDKFRQLTQYVEDSVDLAKSADYWFEPQLLRQARVFRPNSPSFDDTKGEYINGGGNNASNSNNRYYSPLDSSRGPLDHISEIVERRLVKASGLYGVHQRVIEVEFLTKSKSSSSLWKGGAGIGNIHSSFGGGGTNGSVNGSNVGETVIRAIQGEEEYLMGLSLMCEPGR